MADRTAIQWTDATWNPIIGCSVVSPGCTNCYAMKMAARIEAMQPGSHYAGTTLPGAAVWSGKVALAPTHILTLPLRWRRPRRIFVNSMGDLFHEAVPDAWIDRVFAVMALCPQHTFQVLTKRSARMRAYACDVETPRRIAKIILFESRGWGVKGEQVLAPLGNLQREDDPSYVRWPLPNVWLGVSAEDQRRADERIPDLLATPAAIRFASCEPLLGLIDFDVAWHGESALDAECWGDCAWCDKGYPPLHNCQHGRGDWERGRSGLDLVIAGGESGPHARPMHPDWARALRDACATTGVPFFFKQWGEWISVSDGAGPGPHFHFDDGDTVRRVGKARAGRLLDGIEHNALPATLQETA